MPLVRISKKGDDTEALPAEKAAGIGTGELGRITTNMTLAQHIGQFVAGEVASQFQNENLADALKGKNMIMISGSWG